jgi:hypothetical protein
VTPTPTERHDTVVTTNHAVFRSDAYKYTHIEIYIYIYILSTGHTDRETQWDERQTRRNSKSERERERERERKIDREREAVCGLVAGPHLAKTPEIPFIQPLTQPSGFVGRPDLLDTCVVHAIPSELHRVTNKYTAVYTHRTQIDGKLNISRF